MKITFQNAFSMRYVVQRQLSVAFLLEKTAKVLTRYRCHVKCHVQHSVVTP
jgi:hypothetical protein